MADRENDIIELLEKSDEKAKKKRTRTKKSEEVKKVKKITKKEQQILDIEKNLVIPDNYHLVNTPELLDKLVNYYKAYKTMYAEEAYTFLDTETYGLNNWKDEIITFQIGFMSDQHFFIPLRPFKHEMSKDVPHIPLDLFIEKFKPLLEEDYLLVLANAKFDIHVLYNWCGIDITYNIFWDTNIAGGLLNENHPKGLKEWYNNYALPDMINRGVVDRDERLRPTFKFGAMFDKIPFDEIPHRLAWYYGAHDPYMTKAVFEYQKRIFENPAFGLEKVYQLFREVEMPLIAVFTEAERRGVALDGDFLRDVVGGELAAKLTKIKGQIFEHLGSTIVLTKTKTRQKKGIKYKEEYESIEELNLGSPTQVARKLYTEHNILEPVMEYDKELKKEVPKFKTDKKTLTRNKKAHPVIPLLLEYRGLSKLIDAFCNKLPDDAVNGRVHCSYNQLVRTGRMSCSNPNLQQIPAKFDLIRYAFRADKGRLLVSADFSQQELRWLAIVTGEPTLIEVFENGLDMHSRITCQIHGLSYDMFEEIRGHKGDSEAETKQNVKNILSKWSGTSELEYATKYFNEKSGKQLDSDNVKEDAVYELADFFEALRKKTKSVVFGVVYGITEIGLADQIESSKEEAKSLIDGFKAGLPYYLQWEATTHRKLMEDGYIETALGRKRRFGEVIAEAMATELWKKRRWHYKIEKAKRQSCNAIIQGSSADQSKKAIVELFYPKRPDGTICLDRREWLQEGYKSLLEELNAHIILQVHDELIFDVPVGVPFEDLKRITDVMANCIPNSVGVKFKSDIEAAPYWGGKFTPEQIKGMAEGTFDWTKVFEAEVSKKLGIEYEMGTFIVAEEDEDEEEVV